MTNKNAKFITGIFGHCEDCEPKAWQDVAISACHRRWPSAEIATGLTPLAMTVEKGRDCHPSAALSLAMTELRR